MFCQKPSSEGEIRASGISDNCFVRVLKHISRTNSIVIFEPLMNVLKKAGGKDRILFHKWRKMMEDLKESLKQTHCGL